MKKNVASQTVGVQMITAADGTAFTGAVTVAVTGDAGTQATGIVGSGACTHEGNGYHTYAPAQAETNYDLVAFTFTGTGAIPVTVQIYTRPTTGLLAPTVADRTLDVTATGAAGIDWANVENQGTSVDLSATAISLCDTTTTATTATNLTNLPTIPANWLTAAGTAADFTTEIQAGLATAAALATVGSNVDAILTDTGTTLPATLATIAGYIDTEIATIISAIGTVDTVVDGIQTDLSNATDGLGALKALIDTMQGNVTDILADTNELQADDYPTTLATLATSAELAKVPKSDGTSSWNATALAAIRTQALATALADDYAAHGVAPTLQQAVMMIHQHLEDSAISGTTKTVKKLDGTTAGTLTLTLNVDGEATEIARAT